MQRAAKAAMADDTRFQNLQSEAVAVNDPKLLTKPSQNLFSAAMTRDFVHFSHNDARGRGLRQKNDGNSDCDLL